MRQIISFLLILLSSSTFAQINIKSMGARESYLDNSPYIQKAIDSAVKSGKSVIIPIGNFRVAKPLIVQNWNGSEYRFVFIKIIGESTFWNPDNRSILTATFTDAPLISIQKGKGCIIEGVQFIGRWKAPYSPYNTDINIYRDPNTRDSRFSPYCAIAIDPFCFYVPEDGGYPSLTAFYRGNESRGGSTGIIVKDCIFRGFTVGAITSPNGYTQNAELITFENIQITDCKIGFAGCQAQEKMNRIINVGAWGTTHTLFAFNQYGDRTPGNWIINGVNVAGDVNQILHRYSGGYFPMFISNLYAETIFRFGVWQTDVGDQMSNFVLDFKDNLSVLPVSHFEGGGVTLNNGIVRYYGLNIPIIFSCGRKDQGGLFNLNNVKSTESLSIPSTFIFAHPNGLPEDYSPNEITTAIVKDGQFINNYKVGKTVIFLNPANGLLGWGIMEGNKLKLKSSTIADIDHSIIIR